MRELRERVAVITGAASGIGRGLAERCAGEGMRLVLADVEEAALAETARELEKDGAEVIAVPTDVSDPGQVQALASTAYARFGRVHLLCNNAGVAGGPGAVWEPSVRDWSWVLGVNLMGVVHGLQSFVPHMLEHGEEATSSTPLPCSVSPRETARCTASPSMRSRASPRASTTTCRRAARASACRCCARAR
jgi:NAD(P)-dependent dehydrogenase (short-subunit alcohol dehydrogenase family)